jgi:hypothetical protein
MLHEVQGVILVLGLIQDLYGERLHTMLLDGMVNRILGFLAFLYVFFPAILKGSAGIPDIDGLGVLADKIDSVHSILLRSEVMPLDVPASQGFSTHYL